jgi:hypothetical protein
LWKGKWEKYKKGYKVIVGGIEGERDKGTKVDIEGGIEEGIEGDIEGKIEVEERD